MAILNESCSGLIKKNRGVNKALQLTAGHRSVSGVIGFVALSAVATLPAGSASSLPSTCNRSVACRVAVAEF